MKLWLLPAGLLAGLLIIASGVAFGHGGQYNGPPDVVPPNSGGKGNGGGGGGGGTTIIPQTPGTGTGAPGSFTPGPATPGRGRPARSITGSLRKGGSSPGHEQWEYWWNYNKEAFLNLRERLLRAGTYTGPAGYYLGMGSGKAVAANRVSRDVVERTILPALIQLFTEDDADIVDSAVLAAARILPADKAERVLEPIVKALAHKQDSVQQAATLALGVLGSPKARPVLLHLMSNSPTGRHYLGDRSTVPPLVRAFAALSLGLVGDADDVAALTQVIDRESDAERDLKSCAILALGLFKQGQETIIPYLLEVMGRAQMDRGLRSLAPVSLARIEAARPYSSALGRLLETVRSNKTDNDLMRSCVIALGKLASMQDREVLDALTSVIRSHSDAQSRHFAYIAMGQIGSRDQQGYATRVNAHERLQSMLLTDLVRPEVRAHQPWAALALAIYAREYQDVDAFSSVRSLVTEKLSETFRETSDPSHKGAVAISLGLLEARQAGEALLAELARSRDPRLRGYLAVALGLMNCTDAIQPIQALLNVSHLDTNDCLNLARALGLLGDIASVGLLLDRLETAVDRSIAEASSLVQAIGLIGDATAAPPLLKILTDPRRSGLLRGFAAVGLGLLAEKTKQPWNACISIDLNYRSQTTAISEVLDIL
ncbi:MAG: HEAT repeat domain-containing protein [Planctomycetota bacterium]